MDSYVELTQSGNYVLAPELLLTSLGPQYEHVLWVQNGEIKFLGPRIGFEKSNPAVSIAERTGMSVSQVTDEVLYTGLVEMQELDALVD